MVNEHFTGLEEIIKCVVVGDSGVGKTYLTCAYACNAKYSLEKLVKTHQATVWAVDHYQHDREILERSLCDVDGCPVSMRIWDTFGYHDKDRGFAYREADVIVLCFSVLQPNSLRNIQRVWYPEIRRFSPTTPVVLCGTQADLRYLCFDENHINMEKGLLFKPISPNDIIIPSVGREVAKDIGAPYYESSVLNHFGVSDVFINAARVALIERRKTKFWNTHLRRIQRPLIQPPMTMPVPGFAGIKIAKAFLKSDISGLLNDRSECDVIFLVQNTRLEAHRICLAVSSVFFQELFSLESLMKYKANRRRNKLLCQKFPRRFSPNDSDFIESDLDSTDTESGSQTSTSDDFLSGSMRSSTRHHPTFPIIIPYDHKAVETIEISYEEDPYYPSHKILRTYISLSSDISATAFHALVEYLYIGSLESEVDLNELKKTAELLQIPELIEAIENVLSNQSFLNLEVDKKFHQKRVKRLRELALDRNFLADISFEVDNGIVFAHKALLMARCEMMYAMFNNDFIESASDVIPFPGITVRTFRALQEYLYTGESPCMEEVDCITLIEVANRLCLPRLVNMVEASVVDELLTYEQDEMLQDAILLLEPSELYNAKQLSKFCQYILSINFRDVTQKHHKLFHELPTDKQELIEQKQWPPVWYEKELEQYNSLSQPLSACQQMVAKSCNKNWGCLCFIRRGKREIC